MTFSSYWAPLVLWQNSVRQWNDYLTSRNQTWHRTNLSLLSETHIWHLIKKKWRYIFLTNFIKWDHKKSPRQAPNLIIATPSGARVWDFWPHYTRLTSIIATSTEGLGFTALDNTKQQTDNPYQRPTCSTLGFSVWTTHDRGLTRKKHPRRGLRSRDSLPGPPPGCPRIRESFLLGWNERSPSNSWS